MTSQKKNHRCPGTRKDSIYINGRRFCITLVLTLSLVSVPISILPTGRANQSSSLPGRLNDINSATPSGLVAQEYVPGEMLVGFQPGARQKLAEVRSSIGASLVKELREIRAEHWRLPPGLDVERAVRVVSANPNIRYAEPNYIVSADQLPSSPNDEYRSDLWAMHNLGQSGGTSNADINAPEAWQISTGSQNVVIGVIDTGIDYTHPDLQNNIWSNPGETGLDGAGHDRATNGIDDDNNGYVDDVRGWDFVNGDNDPKDDNGHGTHVSGTIGAEGNNSVGVVGVNWHVRLMPLKFLNSSGQGTTTDAINAILYASKFKDSSGANIVRITSNSWGGGKRSSALQDAITNSGALFVAAAGNSGSNQVDYPAGYSSANIISVAATDHNDNLATFSNYSSNWVDLGAPGVNIISTYPGNQYKSLNGTSMACPHVSGVAGLIMAASPGLTNTEVKARIMNAVDPIPALAGKTVTGGRLNAGRALLALSSIVDNCSSAPCSPADLTDLIADNGAATPTSVTLRLTATGDDGTVGAAYLYDVRYSTAPVTPANFSQATVANGESVPKVAGLADSITINGLKPNTTYYFGVRVADELGNYSSVATTSGTTAPGVWSVSLIDDQVNNVGFYSSLAYDKSSNALPSIGYSDEGADDLKLARWDGNQWNLQTVDAGSGVRTGISLAFDPNNNPTLSYGWGPLKFAQFVPSTQSWQITVLESRNANNDITSLVYAPDGNPSIAYQIVAGKGATLKLARKNATGWALQTVATAFARYKSLAFDSAGNPSIAFSDDIDNDGWLDTLKFARWNGTSWVVQIVETGVVGYGVFASLAYDNAGNPAIVQRDGSGVRFLRWNGSAWNPAEIVGTGSYCWLTFNSTDGSFYVSYSDENNLKLSKREIGGWTTELVDAGIRVRYIAPLAISPCGSPSMSYSTNPNNDLKFATKCPLGP